ncbi:MAG TPA: efflux RND transporter periplasmic adaptor subunit [Steroidobacteraceae bacterium]|nr:efflux RND transporter periplasmic adaptor subunit [Steroidobacteraceae bacterium]
MNSRGRTSTIVAVGLLLAAGSSLSGCSHTGSAPAAQASQAVASVTAALMRVPLEQRLDGTVEAIDTATVSAQTAGRVTALDYDVDDFVPAGAVIAHLRGTQQRAGLEQAQAAVRAAQADSDEAASNYQRVDSLYRQRVLPKADDERALAARDARAAQLAAAQAALARAREGLDYTEIRAPYAMVITRRLVQVGELVGPGSAVIEGLAPEHLRVDVEIPESDITAVRQWHQAAIYVQGQRIPATRLTIFPEASSVSSTIHARLQLPPEALRAYPGIYLDPGMYVSVGVVIGEAEHLLIPSTAVLYRSELTCAYVLEGRHWTLRYLRLGHRFGERVQVLAGLSAGERVATDVQAAAASAAGGTPDASPRLP